MAYSWQSDIIRPDGENGTEVLDGQGVYQPQIEGGDNITIENGRINASGTLENVNADWAETDPSDPSYIEHKPDLSIYATASGMETALAGKQDVISDLATIRSGAEAGSTAVQPGDLAAVATTGSYTSLSNTPQNIVQDANYVHTDNNFSNADKSKLDGIAAGAEVNVQPNWNETDSSSDAYIANKPTIPAAQVNSDWNASSGVSAILNKPDLRAYATDTELTDGLATKQNVISDLSTIRAGAALGLTAVQPSQLPSSDELVPSATSGDSGKVLTVDAQGDAVWQNVPVPSVDEVPAVTSSDDGKVLTASYSGGTGSYSWQTAQGGGGSTVDAGAGLAKAGNTVYISLGDTSLHFGTRDYATTKNERLATIPGWRLSNDAVHFVATETSGKKTVRCPESTGTPTKAYLYLMDANVDAIGRYTGLEIETYRESDNMCIDMPTGYHVSFSSDSVEMNSGHTYSEITGASSVEVFIGFFINGNIYRFSPTNLKLMDNGNLYSEVPTFTSADANKVLTVDTHGAAVWQNVPTPSVDEVPAVTSSDDGKVLKASYSGGQGSYAWETASGGDGGVSTVTIPDITYTNSTSTIDSTLFTFNDFTVSVNGNKSSVKVLLGHPTLTNAYVVSQYFRADGSSVSSSYLRTYVPGAKTTHPSISSEYVYQPQDLTTPISLQIENETVNLTAGLPYHFDVEVMYNDGNSAKSFSFKLLIWSDIVEKTAWSTSYALHSRVFISAA